MPEFSQFAAGVKTESAFDVLAIAKRLKAAGKDVVELEIGDSPFPSASHATSAGIGAIEADQCHYGPSAGIPEFRQTAAEYLREHDIEVSAEQIVAGPGAKTFQQLFCEAFLNPGDGVLVFSPHFPTYPPNIERRGARMVLAQLRQADAFRPRIDDVKRFVDNDPQPKAIFLNSPHNPTGGITLQEDLMGIADVVRGQPVYIFSDEPYDQMLWQGRHHSMLAVPGMVEQTVAAYTFSKSYSMSGWRLGFAASSVEIANMLAKLTNTALSCVPPFVQLAGVAAIRHDRAERDLRMQEFQHKVTRLVDSLNRIDGVHCLMPGGTFYAFPNVAEICNRHQITSHGLAMFLLEAADAQFGVACLGGECFGDAGHGFLRLSCAEPDDRLQQAVAFMTTAFADHAGISRYLETHESFRQSSSYVVGGHE